MNVLQGKVQANIEISFCKNIHRSTEVGEYQPFPEMKSDTEKSTIK